MKWITVVKTIFFYFGAIIILLMSAHYFDDELSGIMVDKAAAQTTWYPVLLKAHILWGLVAIFTGPIQFIPGLREANFRRHKRIGYAYFLSVMASGLAGLMVAQYAMGGTIAQIGFTIMAVLWLATTYLALRAVRKKNFIHHQRWMTASYAMTFVAITQRVMLLIPLLVDVAFLDVYRWSAWLPWMINLTIAYAIIRFESVKS